MLVVAAVLVVAAAGLPIGVALFAVLVATSPTVAIVVGPIWLLVWGWRRRSPSAAPPDEAEFCSAIAAELRAGAALREALATAADQHDIPTMGAVARAARAGAPPKTVGRYLHEALPVNGRHASLAFRLAADTGAGSADVFNRLAARAAWSRELDRERDGLTAQARLSAYVVGGAPLVVAALLFATGHISLGGSTGGSLGVLVAALGLGLVGAGMGVVWLLLKMAAR